MFGYPQKLTAIISLFALQTAPLCLASNDTFNAYNEAQSPDGELRPAFKALMKRTGVNPLNPSPQSASKLSNSPLGDEIKILPIPWALDMNEYIFIQDAVAQRGEALRKLFVDLFINDKPEIIKKGLFTQDWIEQLCLSEAQRSYKAIRNFWKHRKAEDVSFIYGPDLARLLSGVFVIIEDNIGNVGGRADTFHLKEPFTNATGIKSAHPYPELDDFVAAIMMFMKKANTNREKTLALVEIDKEEDEDKTPFSYKDLEHERELKVLQNTGLSKIFDIKDLTRKRLEELKTKIDSEGIEAIVFMDHPNGTWDLYDDWMEFLAERPNIKIFNAPYINVLSSKALMPYMEQIIAFYLKDEPKIKTLESLPVSTLDDLDVVEEFYGKNYILKAADGSQGKEVYSRAHTPEKNWQAIRKHLNVVRAWGKYSGRVFPAYIAQPFVNFSYLPSQTPWLQFMVDLRPITYVFMEHVMPTTNPWARANIRLGNNLTNVSQGAFETVVLIENCEDSLTE